MEVCSTALLQVGKSCFCMSRSCNSSFGIGGGILVSASVPVSQWLVRGRLLAHAEFYKTWVSLAFWRRCSRDSHSSCRISVGWRTHFVAPVKHELGSTTLDFLYVVCVLLYRVWVPHWRAALQYGPH